MNAQQPLLVTVQRACELLSVDRKTLWLMHRIGQIEMVTIRRARRVPMREINRLAGIGTATSPSAVDKRDRLLELALSKQVLLPAGMHVVYFLFWRGGLVYIGQTTNLASRLGGHVSSGKRFDAYHWFDPAPDDPLTVEASLIERFRPSYNRGWTYDPGFRSDVPVALRKRIVRARSDVGMLAQSDPHVRQLLVAGPAQPAEAETP